MSAAERHALAKHRAGKDLSQDDVCATIACETELEQYRLGLKQRGALDAVAMKAIEVRRHALRAAKGVRGFAS
ncbi:MAG: hypothetical protein V4659_03980 [Pseudomonadota bacterium]